VSGEVLGVAFKTLGCKVNQVESEDIVLDLLGRGAAIVGEDAASVIVVNTCTVTGEADAKARKAVRHALGAVGAPVVVVTGCMAALSRESLESLGERVIVETDKDRIAGRVIDLLRPPQSGLDAGPVTPVRSREAFRTRAMLKIEDGCDAFCSYCVVPYARGGPKPVLLSRIEAHAAGLVADGVREIVLTGVNVGRYEERGRDLADVVTAVAAGGVDRLRLSSIEPLDLTDRLLETLARLPAACHHLHVPLQSGSDAVLRAMARRYSAAEYEGAVLRAREALPGLALTTDVIAGFPGESDAEARETLDFCRRLGFAKLHVFRYSEREGTPAASMPGRVDPRVRATRATALRQLDAELQRSFAQAHDGAEVEVLIERVTPPCESGRATRHAAAAAIGTTRDYLKVEIQSDVTLAVGDLVGAEVIDSSAVPVRARLTASAGHEWATNEGHTTCSTRNASLAEPQVRVIESEDSAASGLVGRPAAVHTNRGVPR
jgi:threonylcarbamoyladenosine tRNA methylthiotransferase MtaB